MLLICLTLSGLLLYRGYYLLAILVVFSYFLYKKISDHWSNNFKAYTPIIRKLVPPYAYEKRFLKTYQIEQQSFYNTEVTYQKHSLAKRSGGIRTLLIPNANLKTIQHQLLNGFNSHLSKKVHKCAHAYVKGKSIKTNAAQHVGNKVLIKLDIEKFFDSINKQHLKPYLRSISWSGKVQDRLTELLLTDNGLPQGAPTSPFIANIILYHFDVKVLAYCVQRNYKYTRYADDITVSMPEDNSQSIGRVIKFVEEALENNGFRLNKKSQKLNVLRPHQAQRVCGVTINSGKLTISKKHRRLIRSAQHYKTIDKKPSFSEEQLQGHEAYIKMIMQDRSSNKCYWCYRNIPPAKVLSCPKCDYVSRGKTLVGIKKHWKDNHPKTKWVFDHICESHSKEYLIMKKTKKSDA